MKGSEPEGFLRWKSQANENWIPTFDVLQSPEKPELHRALVSEQGSVCCYCEARISGDISHIEHFRPQSRRPDLAMDYSNLFASCGRPSHGRSMPEHCGVKKAEWYEEVVEEKIVSPLSSACEAAFRYTGSGEIRPALEENLGARAEATIDLLGLDHSLLNAQRREAIDGLLFPDETFDEETLSKIIDGLADVDTDGRYQPFATALIYVGRTYFGA